MKMSALWYYADFAVYPVILIGLVAMPILRGDDISPLHWITAAFIGILIWTFLEYSIHRFILHNIPYFSKQHDQHHAAPGALIGAPLLLTLPLLLGGVYLPASYGLGFGPGAAFSFGVTFGYLFYGFTHFAMHHWTPPKGGIFFKWQRIHALHHHSAMDSNFGVTSLLWDYVFGTVAKPHKRRRAQLENLQAD